MENLLGLSQQNSSAGSFLQEKDRVRFQHEDETSEVHWPRSSVWIVGREMLLYQLVDLSSIPENQRNKVIARKIEQASPFEDTGHFACMRDGQAMLWMWDEAVRKKTLEETLAQYSVLSKHILGLPVIPETVLQLPVQDGELARSCNTGADIQTWRSGVLISSIWTPRAAGSLADYVDTPWSASSRGALFASEPLLWRLGLLVLCLVLAFQLGSISGLSLIGSRLDSQLANHRERISGVAQSRGEVRRINQQNAQLLEWTGQPSQLALLAEFDALLPASADFKEWNFGDRQLKLLIEDEKLDNRTYLEALSTSSLVSDVQVAPGSKPGTAMITMEIVSP